CVRDSRGSGFDFW
nr:immunoglobulin heavy chain junction region [Macaca mulatta]MOX91693.1 immunoglobulin heavy chain junction region [Macaca mulatta]MOX91737.1 immunoglobulin heavy chain junction region [Macaca mulatta]MOX92101.1 immunoglobulin heavy chain junction region [Macaca mulatta]MOX92415.1 immunoglobulin heavy chain junction region [Macaca mulatta]